MNTVLCDVYHYFRIEIPGYIAAFTIFLVTFFTWEGNRLAETELKKYVPPGRGKTRFLTIFFLTGTLLSIVCTTVIVYLVGHIGHGYSWQQNSNPLKLNLIYAGLVNLFFHLLHAIHYFFTEYRQQWKEAEELRRIHSQAQVQLVKSQINPHFLFNNLNVLSGMLIKDNPEANRFIEEFSKVYRYILNNQEKELVELRTELEFIEPYLFLLKKRFDEGLAVQMSIPPACTRRYVVPAALQMLIENAIKHNIVSRHKPLQIDIHTEGDDTLVVTNNLQPRHGPESTTRIGLQNIMKRYELICGRTVIVSRTDRAFEVRLPLLGET